MIGVNIDIKAMGQQPLTPPPSDRHRACTLGIRE